MNVRVIIYGIGKRYLYFFNNQEFVEIGLIKNEVEVVGFADGSQTIWGKEIAYNNNIFRVKSIDAFDKSDYDKIVVTTKERFTEIQEELVKRGYESNCIFLIDSFFETYLDTIYGIENFREKTGIEIGGPSALFYNIYNKCAVCDGVNFSSYTVWWENETNDFRYMDKTLGVIWIADATDMHQIGDEKYDFVLSSNNLEHIANPLKALREFVRLVKIGGVVLVVVPQKEKTFDHNREYTTFDHILQDYLGNIGEDDLSHLPEIVEKHDYDMNPSCGGKEKFIERANKNAENRCLHHHVFDERCLRKAFEYVGLRVICFGKVTENWYIIGRR